MEQHRTISDWLAAAALAALWYICATHPQYAKDVESFFYATQWVALIGAVAIVGGLVFKKRHRDKDWHTDEDTGMRYRITRRQRGHVAFAQDTHSARVMDWGNSYQVARALVWGALIACFCGVGWHWLLTAPKGGWAAAAFIPAVVGWLVGYFSVTLPFVLLVASLMLAGSLRGRDDLGAPAPVVQPKGPYGETLSEYSGEHLR